MIVFIYLLALYICLLSIIIIIYCYLLKYFWHSLWMNCFCLNQFLLPKVDCRRLLERDGTAAHSQKFALSAAANNPKKQESSTFAKTAK